MFVEFFLALKEARIPVTLREFLALLEAMKLKVVSFNVDDFYFLSRSCLVKDERNLDKFDQVFSSCFEGLELGKDLFETEIPDRQTDVRMGFLFPSISS